MPRTETWPLDKFEPDANELSRHDDPGETRRLGEDMLARGQLQRVAALETGRFIFGHGRWLAAKAAGIKTLEVDVYPAMSDTEFMLKRASENLQRKELTGYRRWRLCADIMCANPEWQQKDLAEHLHLDPSMVTRLVSPSKCVAEVVEALRENKIAISDAYEISKAVDREDQLRLLSLKCAGASREVLAAQGRKQRAAATPAVRMNKIKCPLPSGHVITVAGDSISLDDAIESLKEALKAMTKARDTGLSAASAQRVWADMSKAG